MGRSLNLWQNRGSWMVLSGMVIAFGGTSARANPIITNGSFEDPVITYPDYFTGSVNGWTSRNAYITSATSLAGYGGSATAADGNQFLTLNHDGNTGSASQDFTTVMGTTYTVTFYENQFYGGNDNTQPTEESVSVSVGDFAQAFTYERGNVNNSFTTDPTWTKHTFTFTATGTTSTLNFDSTIASPNNYGLSIDNVSVDVPEPATLSIFGIAGLSVLRRRRR